MSAPTGWVVVVRVCLGRAANGRPYGGNGTAGVTRGVVGAAPYGRGP